jgi:RNase P subunit RPR2
MVCYRTDKDFQIHYILWKMNDLETKNTLKSLLCDWCNSPMPPGNQSKNSVCSTCHHLLLGAGVSDKEIFLSEDLKSKRKRLDTIY